jgi:hypothetical protein
MAKYRKLIRDEGVPDQDLPSAERLRDLIHPGGFKLDRERRDAIEPVRDHQLGSILSIPRPIDT